MTAPSDESTVVLATTVDEAHLDYLAVVVRSALDELADGWKLRVFVLGYEISDEARRRFEALFSCGRVECEWRSPDLEMIRGHWPGAVGGGVVLYYRLYLAEILPATVDRVLFLDADILVTGDLAELWTSPFEGRIAQAVPDAYAHVMHVPRLQLLDLPDDVHIDPYGGYFNAGVLMIDLESWRRERVSARATKLMWTHGANLPGRDQDALNLVLAGRWKPLSVTWNFHELPERMDSWSASADNAETLREAILRPRIIHFIGCKPWASDCLHQGRGRWREVADSIGLVRPRSGPRLFWLRASLHDLQWQIRRAVLEAKSSSGLAAVAWLLVSRPWLTVVYPCWAALQRMRQMRRARARVV